MVPYNPSSSWLLSLGVMGRDRRATGERPHEYQHHHRFFECRRQHLVVDLQLLQVVARRSRRRGSGV
ncbi:hypothetical protein ACFXTO_047248 [Malus domestica]